MHQVTLRPSSLFFIRMWAIGTQLPYPKMWILRNPVNNLYLRSKQVICTTGNYFLSVLDTNDCYSNQPHCQSSDALYSAKGAPPI